MYFNTPLYAARAGQVNALSYGIIGVAAAGRTETDYYVHIDRPAVGFGAWVVQGGLIAYSGNKVPAGGYLTGPHLHFEVNTGGLNRPASSLDPIPVLQPTFSGGQGGLTNDMTPQESALLLAVAQALGVNVPGAPIYQYTAELNTIKAELDAIKNQGVNATIDPTSLTAAVIAAMAPIKIELDVLAGDVTTVKRLLEKDLAP